jgi:DNA adenine methylase
VRYPGGKFRCYQKLINLIPPHRVYIETHLGGGAVLRHKAPAELNIGIDRDHRVIEKFSTGFDSSYIFLTEIAEAFLKSYRFRGDEFVYMDPPYWPETRRSPRSPYRFDYTKAEHIALLGILKSLPCRVMISGYGNQVYDRELQCWGRYSFGGTSHTGRRQEAVWLNFRPSVVHDNRYLGETFRERQSIQRKRARWVSRFRREVPALQHAILNDLSAAFAGSSDERQTNL